MTKKEKTSIYFVSYRRHRIFYDIDTKTYHVAIKRNGTDDFFMTLEDAYNAIDSKEGSKE